MEKISVCICGGGALGHVIAGYFASKDFCEVNILTRKPELWNKKIEIEDNQNKIFTGRISTISNKAEELIPQSKIILLCLPGFAIEQTLLKIKPYLNEKQYLGSVVSSTGFFFIAKQLFAKNIKLFGFQRVPFIARVKEYGKSAELLGYKQELKIAGLHIDNALPLTQTLSILFDTPIKLLNNFLEVSLSNSNPLLHTIRLYDLFKDYKEGIKYSKHFLFYKEWTVEASKLLIQCDKEFQNILSFLPIQKDEILPLLDYYESKDAIALTEKIRNIKAFRSLKAPMVRIGDNSYIPDFNSRYFTEDFPYGLSIIKLVAQKHELETPQIDLVLEWAKKNTNESLFNTTIKKIFSKQKSFQ